jgi:hypothetical protein
MHRTVAKELVMQVAASQASNAQDRAGHAGVDGGAAKAAVAAIHLAHRFCLGHQVHRAFIGGRGPE